MDAALHAGRPGAVQRRPRAAGAPPARSTARRSCSRASRGYGRVANDIYSPFDPAYAGDEFPQRRYDPEQAQSLLKAGRPGGPLDRAASRARPTRAWSRARRSSRQNAKAAGVNVNVKDVDGGTIYGDQYLKWPFSADYWGTRNYLQQVAAGMLKTAPFNETHWDAYPGYNFESLYRQALATVDEKKRAQIIKEMQRMEYNDGGYIIWVFKNLTDAYSAKVGGFKVDKGTLNLDKYGNNFRTIFFV